MSDQNQDHGNGSNGQNHVVDRRPDWMIRSVQIGQAKEAAERNALGVLVDTMMTHQGELKVGG